MKKRGISLYLSADETEIVLNALDRYKTCDREYYIDKILLQDTIDKIEFKNNNNYKHSK